MLRCFLRSTIGIGSVLFCFVAGAAPIWQDTDLQQQKALIAVNVLPMPDTFRSLTLDEAAMRLQLAKSEPESTLPLKPATVNFIELPLPDGKMISVAVLESPIMEPALAAAYPDIKTYIVQDADFSGRLDITELGFHGLLFSDQGTVYIDPRMDNGQRYYISYFKRNYNPAGKRSEQNFCRAERPTLSRVLSPVSETFALAAISGEQLRTYRIAIAATGEYTQFHGGTVSAGLSAVTTTLNRVNTLYERDVAVRMILVATNNLIIYTDANTDPYTNTNGSAMLGQNQANLDTVIGSNNYDIGHVVSTGAGGVALLGVVCNNRYKANGVTGTSTPIGDPFDIDYVAHEIGHEFGAEHTFNSTSGSCNGNRNSATAYEPGSGSTVMAYAGICSGENLQVHSDTMFHPVSIDQIVAYTTNDTGNTCAAISLTNNSPPTVTAGLNYTIPANTPFELSGSATDANSDTLTYSWEQMDLGTASTANNQGDNGNRPIFRSFAPSLNDFRIFPRLTALIDNVTSNGEWLPTTSRSLHFRLTVRDQKGGVNSDSTIVTVDNLSGPFRVLSPNGGENFRFTAPVSWNRSGTDTSQVNCQNVDILLSSDSGETFNGILSTNTPNDGSQEVNFPQNSSSSTARIKVKCNNNVFFDISDEDFSYRAINTPPVAMNDNFDIQEDSDATILNILLNDTDPDADDTQQIVDVVTPNKGGTAVINNNSINNDLSYKPAQNYVGTETFTYTMQDSFGATSSATVTINVMNINDPPLASDDEFILDQNSADTVLQVLENDNDIDLGDSKSIVSVSNPNQGGTVVIDDNNNQNLIYHPATDFIGIESFTYTMQDFSGAQSSATVTITIIQVNRSPIAANDSITVAQNSVNNTIGVLSNDTDPDSGDTMTVVSVSTPDNGGTVVINGNTPNNTLNYTPNTNFSGTENFSYVMQDSFGLAATAFVTITVEAEATNPKPGDTSQNKKRGSGAIAWQMIVLLLGLFIFKLSNNSARKRI